MALRFPQKIMDMAKALDARKGEDILLIDVGGNTIVADYFIVCSGRSTIQVKTLADELEMKMDQQGIHKLRVEGYQAGRWIVLDYGDVLVHIFHSEEREFYDIERLWRTLDNSEVYKSEEAE